MDYLVAKFFSKNYALDLKLKNELMPRNCPRKPKKAKMNNCTQKCFTLKNVWKIIFENIDAKIDSFFAFTLKVQKKKVFSMQSVWKMIYL